MLRVPVRANRALVQDVLNWIMSWGGVYTYIKGPLTFWFSRWEKQKRDSGCVHRGVRADEPKAGCSPTHSASGESLCQSPPAAGARDADGLHTHHTQITFCWNSNGKTLVFIYSHWLFTQCEWIFDLKSFFKKLIHKNRKGFCTDLYDSLHIQPLSSLSYPD